MNKIPSNFSFVFWFLHVFSCVTAFLSQVSQLISVFRMMREMWPLKFDTLFHLLLQMSQISQISRYECLCLNSSRHDDWDINWSCTCLRSSEIPPHSIWEFLDAPSLRLRSWNWQKILSKHKRLDSKFSSTMKNENKVKFLFNRA